MSNNLITIDATNEKIGRLASSVATILNGKDNPNYSPNIAPKVKVEVNNLSKMLIDDKKKVGKVYDWYTGYFSGRKTINLKNLIIKKGHTEVFKKAVYGMLPSNRLRNIKMKNLILKD